MDLIADEWSSHWPGALSMPYNYETEYKKAYKKII